MDQLTAEQKRQLDRLKYKFIAKSILNGFHSGLMAVFMNIVLFMGVQVFLDGNSEIELLGSVFIGFFVVRRMLLIMNDDVVKLHEDAKKIIK